MIELLPFCVTDTQRKVIEAVIAAGSARKAAEMLGVHHSSVDKIIIRVKKRAASKGVAPSNDLDYPLPEGQFIKGTSTLIDKRTGESMLQWVKTDVDMERRLEIMREVADALKEDLPKYPCVTSGHLENDLMNLYVITDYHLGMKSWAAETGTDWDLEIAENVLINWFKTAINQAPYAETGVFAQLGDFLHWDGMDAVTPQHRNLLDADTRFQKLIRVAIRVIRRIITALLELHKHVHIVWCDANHDPASSAWIREWLKSVYENEPRLTVDDSAATYYCHKHGDTVNFFHHGHKSKINEVDRVFTGLFPVEYGLARHRYAHIGHYHQAELRESPLMTVERHRTLAAPDAYAAKAGYLSGRDAKVITYHKKYGEVGRVIVSPDMALSDFLK